MIRKRNNGFTLVELLVVIGVIAALISLLLPVLQKARDQAKRVSCLSNMRQVYLDYLIYANNYHDFLPMGIAWSDKTNSNTVMHYAGSSASQGSCYENIGWVYYANMMKSPKIYFCPADITNVYNPKSFPLSPTTYSAYRVGYSVRPETRWVDLSSAPVNGYNASIAGGQKMPKLAQLRDKAIISEVVYVGGAVGDGSSMFKTSVGGRHRNGMNAMFADGAGMFVSYTYFKTNLETWDTNRQPYYILNDPKGNANAQNVTTKPYMGIWADLETAHGSITR